MKKKSSNYLEFIRKLESIRKKDPEGYEALTLVINHIAETYNDKYQSDVINVIDTKVILTKMIEGKGANFQNAGKYLQRYFSKGFSKSYNVTDLYKAIHYIIFEITRRINEDGKLKRR